MRYNETYERGSRNSLIGILIITEAGIVIFNKSMKIIISEKFNKNQTLSINKKIELGKIDSKIKNALSKAKERGFKGFLIKEDTLKKPLEARSFTVEIISDIEFEKIQKRKTDIMIKSGLVKNEYEARQRIREIAFEISKTKLREFASKLDLQLIQSIQSLDEVDKIINIFESRVKEWYGLHFPELERVLDNSEIYMKFIIKFRSRENIVTEELEKFGLSNDKILKLTRVLERTKGSNVRTEDFERIVSIAKECLHLHDVRKELSSYVDKNMNQIAPNINSIVGSTIGARLLARAGGLEKLAKLPASTIQILGAEKALFRSMRTGTRPPKHGILFQHLEVHTAPKWQRGKIARSLAGKIAIASRIDAYRGTLDDGIKNSLEKRFEEIKTKYPEPILIEKEFKKRKQRKSEVNEKKGSRKSKTSKNKRQR
jgi:nucleolar protein 56